MPIRNGCIQLGEPNLCQKRRKKANFGKKRKKKKTSLRKTLPQASHLLAETKQQ